MDCEQIVTKLDDIDKKYQDSANLSAKAIKELGEQQLKFAKDLEKIGKNITNIVLRLRFHTLIKSMCLKKN